MRITWKELAIDLTDQSSDELLSEWLWLLPESMLLRMVSSLGDAFLSDADGKIYWLDVGGAELTLIANDRDQFDALRQHPENADQWFAPLLVGDIMSSGKTLKENECFSYKIPLTLGGLFEEENFEPCDLSVHFATLGQIQHQIKDMPIGTKIDSIKIDH